MTAIPTATRRSRQPHLARVASNKHVNSTEPSRPGTSYGDVVYFEMRISKDKGPGHEARDEQIMLQRFEMRESVSQVHILRAFVVKFVITCGVVYTLAYWLPWPVRNLGNQLTAEMLGIVLRMVGSHASVQGVVVRTDAFAVEVITECTPLVISILYFSFVFSYPASTKQKMVGLSLGIPVLVTANLCRLAFIFLVGERQEAFFEYAHVYLGQIVMILLVFLTCIVWLRSVVMIRTDDSPITFLARFTAFSCPLFLAWLFCHKGCVWIHLHAVKLLLGFFNLDFSVPNRIQMYPHSFDTFNLVAYGALIFATTSIARRKKVKALLAGLALLSIVHLIFRLLKILFLHFNFQSAFGPFIGLIIINEWGLPFALWLTIVRREIFKRKGVYVCPICGEEKIGLLEHIRAKHGEKALKNPAVQGLAEEMGQDASSTVTPSKPREPQPV